MKRIGLGIIMGILLITVTACDKEKTEIIPTTNTQKGQIHEHCVRIGHIDDESSADLSYEVYYTGDIINRIESTEKVTSTSSATLDTYEEAYRKIHSYYENIDHYDTNLIRTSNSVTSTMIIDYDKIDIAKLIELEGEENNIFENNQPKIDKYKEFSKKVGTTCTVVE